MDEMSDSGVAEAPASSEPAPHDPGVTTAKIEPPDSDDDGKAPGHPDGDPLNHHRRAQGEPDREKHADKVTARLYGGEEKEYTQAELLDALNTDGRTFKIGGEEKHLKWNEIQRMVELGNGAFGKMQQAAELRKEIEAARGRGRQGGDDAAWYLQEHLGINPDQWANERMYAAYQRDQEIQQLMQTNPALAQQRMREQESERIQRDAEMKRAREESERQSEESKRQRAEFRKAIPGHLKEAGVPHNELTEALFYNIGRKWAEVGQILEPAQVAAMAADEFRQMVWGHVGGLDDERLLEGMGKDMRKRIRALEAKALKASGKAAPRSSGDGAKTSPSKVSPAKGKTMSEWLKQFG